MNKKLWCLVGVHEYKVLDKGPYRYVGVGGETVKSRTWYTSNCQVCGKLKTDIK